MRRAILLTAALTLCCDTSRALTPDDPGPANVSFVINSSINRREISPLIYGSNSGRLNYIASDRLGGNRWTAYNWENNASNAGSDYFHQNDGFLSSSSIPGQAVRPAIQTAASNNRALVVTVPIAGYVSADKNGGGDVNQTPNYLQTRFNQVVAKKGSPLSLTPNLSDDFVYTDEFVNWVETSGRVNAQQQIIYSLDNEPDLWSGTHNRIHPNPTGYQELVDKTIAHAGAIKDVKPDAQVFGAVNYGWQGFRSLQNAPDRAGRDFHDYFLAQMKTAELAQGRRLVDALDIHWYPEARGNNIRIIDGATDTASITARVQAPRSLWDAGYTETSWIAQDSVRGPIQLLNRVNGDINTHYPGTKIAVTEYNYGASNHISGGIAQADVLGIFGREGVHAANWWDLTGSADPFVQGAFDMFRNYNGAGGKFGTTSIRAVTTSNSNSAIYASVDESKPNEMILVAINRTATDQTASIRITDDRAFDFAEVYRMTSGNSTPARQADFDLTLLNAFIYNMPAYSVSTIVLRNQTLAGDYNDDGQVDAADYTAWRDALGGASLENETATLGVVDQADYEVWLDNFGSGSGPGSSAAVPEPSSLISLLACCLLREMRKPAIRRSPASMNL